MGGEVEKSFREKVKKFVSFQKRSLQIVLLAKDRGGWRMAMAFF